MSHASPLSPAWREYKPTLQTQGDHVVLKCTNAACGMRYPCPANNPRRHACPLCESPVTQVGSYTNPPEWPTPAAPDGQRHGPLVAVLDNIRSALNVGTMLRSADGARLDHVYLGGLTAAANNPKVVKTALGAEQVVPSTSCLDTTTCLTQLRDDGYAIWAIDYTAQSVAIETVTERPERLAFVVGNERAGVDPDILAASDRHVHLAMHGHKSTLNVGVAFGTVAYFLRSLDSRAALGEPEY